MHGQDGMDRRKADGARSARPDTDPLAFPALLPLTKGEA
jgi:hypothetical protein